MAEKRLFDHEQTKQPDALRYRPKRELPLLAPSTPVRIQNPTTRKWDTTGTVIGFGKNTREYLVQTGQKEMVRNRHFLKPIDTVALPPLRQPVQAPLRPATPTSSEFPVEQVMPRTLPP